MPVTIIIGAQWGDEGKGKVVDLLAPDMDVVARYQGGANAGHTIKWNDASGEEQTFVLHLIPSGIFHAGTVCVVGNGVVIDPVAFLDEVRAVEARGFSVEGRLKVSHTAHLIMPYHKALDRAQERAAEAAEGGEAIGTTGRGIGPAYVDKVDRKGIRVVDLLDPESLRATLTAAIEDKNDVLARIYGDARLDVDAIVDEYVAFDQKIDPYVTDTAAYLHDALAASKRILAEGAQGALLDVDHGTYPFVTSSSPTAGGACTGLGIPPTAVDRVVGIVKAYSTRVGNGPFPTELTDETGEQPSVRRPRVRRDDRPPAAMRLARPRGAPLRDAPQRLHRARDHQARRDDGPGRDQGLHRLHHRRQDDGPLPAGRAPARARDARLRDAPRLYGRPRGRALRGRPARRGARLPRPHLGAPRRPDLDHRDGAGPRADDRRMREEG